MKNTTLLRVVLWCGILVTTISFVGIITTQWWPFIATEAAGIGLMIFSAIEISHE